MDLTNTLIRRTLMDVVTLCLQALNLKLPVVLLYVIACLVVYFEGIELL